MNKLSSELLNLGILDLGIFGNLVISRKSLKCLEIKPSAELAIQNENFDSCTRNYKKPSLNHFIKKLFAKLQKFVYIIFAKIVWERHFFLS